MRPGLDIRRLACPCDPAVLSPGCALESAGQILKSNVRAAFESHLQSHDEDVELFSAFYR